MAKENTLACVINLADLDKEPKSFQLAGTEAELADIATRFDLFSVEALSGTVEATDTGPNQGVLLKGHLTAKFIQKCIASLQPVPEELDTDFELLLVDPEMADRMDDEGVYLDPEAPDYDALEGDEIPLGEILAQTLSISMNPYPRAEGADLQPIKAKGVTINEPELERPNPFAILAKTSDES